MTKSEATFMNARTRSIRLMMTTVAVAAVLGARLDAQGRAGFSPPATPPATAHAAAPIDLTGTWVAVISEDWRWRMITPARGDYASIPMTAEGMKLADTWDPAKDEAAGEQCRSYGAPGLMRGPIRLSVTWLDANTLKVETDYGMQTRLFHFGSWTPPGGPPTWQGNSVARWETPAGPSPKTGSLYGDDRPSASRISPQERCALWRERAAYRVLGYGDGAERESVDYHHEHRPRPDAPARAIPPRPCSSRRKGTTRNGIPLRVRHDGRTLAHRRRGARARPGERSGLGAGGPQRRMGVAPARRLGRARPGFGSGGLYGHCADRRGTGTGAVVFLRSILDAGASDASTTPRSTSSGFPRAFASGARPTRCAAPSWRGRSAPPWIATSSRFGWTGVRIRPRTRSIPSQVLRPGAGRGMSSSRTRRISRPGSSAATASRAATGRPPTGASSGTGTT